MHLTVQELLEHADRLFREAELDLREADNPHPRRSPEESTYRARVRFEGAAAAAQLAQARMLTEDEEAGDVPPEVLDALKGRRSVVSPLGAHDQGHPGG